MKNQMQRWWDVPAALFLLGALFSAAIRLQATNWTEHLSLMTVIVVLGSIFGFALGKSIFRGWITFVMGLVFSLFFVPWQLGLLMPEMPWSDRLNFLYARIYWATADFLANKPVRDPILFLTTMAALYWFASLLSTYRLVRLANPWAPLLSLGGMILVIEYTSEMYGATRISGAGYSFMFLVFCLLLVGRIYFLRSRKEWEQRGGTVEMEVGYDLGRGVAVAAVVVALLAWNTPMLINFFNSEDPARERVSRSFQVFRDRVSKAVNSLRSSSPVVVEGYGSNMFLGTGGQLDDKVVFTVKPEFGKSSRRLYWSARTYDNYRSGQWNSTISDSRTIGPAQEQVMYPSWDLRREMKFTFNSSITLLKTLYYPAEPLSISREAQAVVAMAANGATDLNAIVLDPPLAAGEEYTILASVAQPTILAMREAGAEYPDYIAERYLQLPDSFSPRIAELARQIAGDEETPYDQVTAVTQYLRRTITYSETVPQPPRNRDPLEWFLFDLRAGFCNYYASAEVVMLRSLGIPARLVVGYAEGEWDTENRLYTVIGKDSHAWPEVYFPDLGWVAFEPTVAQPQSTFPQGSRSSNDPSGINAVEPEVQMDPWSLANQEQRAEDLMNAEEIRSAVVFEQFRPWLTGLLVVAAIGVLYSLYQWIRRRTFDLPLPSWIEKALDERGFRTPDWLRLWSRRALRTPMENLFANVAFMLRVWGRKVDPALTPAEQVAMLVNVVPGVQDHALVLLDEYQRAMYSKYPANLHRAMEAVNELRSIGFRSWFLKLVGFGS